MAAGPNILCPVASRNPRPAGQDGRCGEVTLDRHAVQDGPFLRKPGRAVPLPGRRARRGHALRRQDPRAGRRDLQEGPGRAGGAPYPSGTR